MFRSLCLGLVVVLSVLVLVRADETPSAATRWTTTAEIAARGANQAAAADEKYAYAVDNGVIAKYDRSTGKLIATSSGEAKHLNSAFLHQGKLYCAHSNFPRTPERSEIMLLDTDSMQLTTFKDFGNFGGSLTWVLWHDGHWWCNFARYGKNNAETFLVKFDGDWQEQARWTYPAEVIERLGNYSISGGVWHEGKLLVTDHDHGILYEMELPATDNVLHLRQTQRVPFTGQGIANDPATGGLVGINRSTKQIVFAEQK
jgi:hypothetical protein